MQKSTRPGIIISLIPIIFLMVLLIINILIYKDDATSGANQMALLFAGVLSASIGIFGYKQKYKDIEKHILDSIGRSMQANIILLVVGALIGTWILSGIVPTMIYYGLKIIHPSIFLPVSCITCCIVSLATGSSWSTTGTVGIALIGIGHTLGIPEGMVAGAIISGAYFGDKMSPLSDTTNLAPAMAGTDIFTHIRHMMYTSVPAISLAIIGFGILGIFYGGGDVSQQTINQVLVVIDKNFQITPLLFCVPVLVILMVIKKVPALPALLLGTSLGAIFALIFQGDLLVKMAGGDLTLISAYKVILSSSFGGFSIDTGNQLIDSLFNRGGTIGMLNTVWLILMAMIFGGALEGTGMLKTIADSILKFVHGAGSLVGATLTSCVFLNMTACDQYLAIVVPGRMFKKAYDDYGLKPKNLSRALEDAGTVTSVLVPWNSGGAYNSSVLGVATLTYLPFCFFNLLSPLVSAFLAGMDWTIERTDEIDVEDNDNDDDFINNGEIVGA